MARASLARSHLGLSGSSSFPSTTNPIIAEIYATADRKTLGSGISPYEGELIHRTIVNSNANDTIEIGCAFGLSSLFICDALSRRNRPHHVIIDPFQRTDYGGRGLANLQRAGYNFFELIEEPSELALPDLLKDSATFDFALIDGFHTFDHTMVDFFYLNRMLRIGGLIAFDDNDMASVHRVIHYVANYPCYRFFAAANVRGRKRRLLNTGKRIIAGCLRPVTRMMGERSSHEFLDHSLIEPQSISKLDYSTMVIFEKIEEDRRGSEWYHGF